jgi:hypothetical protein
MVYVINAGKRFFKSFDIELVTTQQIRNLTYDRFYTEKEAEAEAEGRSIAS